MKHSGSSCDQGARQRAAAGGRRKDPDPAHSGLTVRGPLRDDPSDQTARHGRAPGKRQARDLRLSRLAGRDGACACGMTSRTLRPPIRSIRYVPHLFHPFPYSLTHRRTIAPGQVRLPGFSFFWRLHERH